MKRLSIFRCFLYNVVALSMLDEFAFMSSPLNFSVAACLKTENDNNLFLKISNRYGALRCFVFSVASSDDNTSIHI